MFLYSLVTKLHCFNELQLLMVFILSYNIVSNWLVSFFVEFRHCQSKSWCNFSHFILFSFFFLALLSLLLFFNLVLVLRIKMKLKMAYKGEFHSIFHQQGYQHTSLQLQYDSLWLSRISLCNFKLLTLQKKRKNKSNPFETLIIRWIQLNKIFTHSILSKTWVLSIVFILVFLHTLLNTWIRMYNMYLYIWQPFF